MPTAPLPPSIEPAELLWRDGIPESAQFGDVYFSRANGLEESRYVFLNRNELPERFKTIPAGGQFVIAESGFGTGLNFLAAWKAWQEHGPDHSATLHFVSVERFPLSRADLTKALDLWPELSTHATQLLEHYPPPTRGAHRLSLAGGRVRLTLYFGDILEAWDLLRFRADAWFLDGFAPSKNPEMWLDEAIDKIKDHSKPGTTLATFTAVGRIRRALSAAGFEMQKVRGFAQKRDMLVGKLPDRPVTHTAGTPRSVAVIGAGIAGCLLAHNLAERGIPVTLLDSAPEPGGGASGNRQGASYVKLGVEFNDQTQLALTSLLFSQRAYAPFRNSYWHPSGLLQLAWSEQEADRQRRFLQRNDYPSEILVPVDQARATQLAGVATPCGGLWFPHSGWLEPSKLCKVLSSHPMINRRFGVRVDGLVRYREQWRISADGGNDIIADSVAVCAGHLTPALLPVTGQLRFKSIRGQVTHLEGQSVRTPSAVVCGPRYLNPAHEGIAVAGATFDLRDMNPALTTESQEQNLSELTAMLPQVLATPSHDDLPLAGRVAFRCTTHDYQPVADEVHEADGAVHSGLYLLTGLGSKGLTYAPLLAEYLADRITGQPECLPSHLARRVKSSRMIRPKDTGAG